VACVAFQAEDLSWTFPHLERRMAWALEGEPGPGTPCQDTPVNVVLEVVFVDMGVDFL
jgi:hypothetical protein